MSLLAEARRHYERRQALAARTVRRTTSIWNSLDQQNLTASFQITASGRLLETVTAAQFAAASMTDPYTDRILTEQGLVVDGLEVNPRAFTGVASDGRPLASLLSWPIVETQFRLRQGETAQKAFRHGRFTLARIVRTQIQDAGRAADGAAAVGRHSVTGYFRYLTPPSCSRCAILAGRFYKTNSGFLRHPHCDCIHVPGTKAIADDVQINPRSYFDSLTPSEQAKVFTKAGAEAIRDGADIGRVVNARRGMTAAGTSEGATFSPTARRGERLMPEQIYRQATSRAEARNLLVANGYLL